MRIKLLQHGVALGSHGRHLRGWQLLQPLPQLLERGARGIQRGGAVAALRVGRRQRVSQAVPQDPLRVEYLDGLHVRVGVGVGVGVSVSIRVG